MKPFRFAFAAPRSLDEALALLAGIDGAKVLAGGQSLLPMLNMRSIAPSMLVDLQHIASLKTITAADNTLVIGAMIRQRDCECDKAIARLNPLLPAVLRNVGSVAIRNRGTVVGSLCQADAAAELPLLLTLLDGTVVARSVGETRQLSARQLFVANGSSSIRRDEIVTQAHFPVLGPQVAWAFDAFSRRRNDRALCMVGALIQRDGDGRAVDVRLAAGGIAPTPIRLAQAEAVLTGSLLDQYSTTEAGRAAEASVTVGDDFRASAAYRRRLVQVLVRRTVTQALERLGEMPS